MPAQPPLDHIRLAARVFFVVGCVAVVLALIGLASIVGPLFRPPVPGGIATPPTFQLLPVLSIVLAPVAPFGAWATLTVLCDIRDELRVDVEADGGSGE